MVIRFQREFSLVVKRDARFQFQTRRRSSLTNSQTTRILGARRFNRWLAIAWIFHRAIFSSNNSKRKLRQTLLPPIRAYARIPCSSISGPFESRSEVCQPCHIRCKVFSEWRSSSNVQSLKRIWRSYALIFYQLKTCSIVSSMNETLLYRKLIRCRELFPFCDSFVQYFSTSFGDFKAFKVEFNGIPVFRMESYIFLKHQSMRDFVPCENISVKN